MGFFSDFKQGLYQGLTGNRGGSVDEAAVKSQRDANAFTEAMNYRGSATQMAQELSGGGYAADPNWKPADPNSQNYYSDLYQKLALLGHSSPEFAAKQQEIAYKQPELSPWITTEMKNARASGYDIRDPNAFSKYQDIDANRKATRITNHMPSIVFPATMIGMEVAEGFSGPNGERPSPTISPEQFNKELNDGKWTQVDLKQREKLRSIAQAEGIANSLNTLYQEIAPELPKYYKGKDSQGLIPFAQRSLHGITARYDPNSAAGGKIKAYLGIAEGTIAPLIKSLGDTGALSNGDTQRAYALVAQMGQFSLENDTIESANIKYNELMKILKLSKRANGGLPPGASASYLPTPDKNGNIVTKRIITMPDGKQFADNDF